MSYANKRKSLSTAWSRYFSAIEAGRVQDAYGMLALLQAQMPPDPDPGNQRLRKYQVVINTTLYRQTAQDKELAVCPVCDEASGYKDEQLSKRTIPADERNRSAMRHPPREVAVWTCPKCHESSDVLNPNDGHVDVDIRMREVSEPHYLGVVPKPPEPPDGESGTAGVEVWVARYKLYLAKLAEEIMHKRSTYYEKRGGEPMDTEFDDQGLAEAI